MDPDLVIAAYYQWQEDNPIGEKELEFEFLGATATSLNFKARGMLFQVIIPAALDLNRNVVSGEFFIALSPDNSAPETFVIGINEKLERLHHVGPRGLRLALDVFSKALTTFKEKRKWTESQDPELDSNVGVGIEGSFGEVEDYTADSNDDSMETNDGSDQDLDDMPSIEDEGLAFADGEPDCSLEIYFKNYNLGQTPRESHNTGYLHVACRAARKLCEAARSRDTNCFLVRPASQNFSVASSSNSDTGDILQFCNFSTIPQCSCVQIQAEVSGIVNDVKIATALGLPFGKRLFMFLEFDRELWSKWYLTGPLEVRRVTVKYSTLDVLDVDHDEVKCSDDKFEAEWRTYIQQKDKNMTYGVKVLLPELIQLYFKYRSTRSVEQLRSKPWANSPLDDALRRFAAADNPLIGLVSFVGHQLRALPGWCAICWSLFPPYSVCSRVMTCQNDLCLYEFEELGMGPTIYQEIQESPDVVEFELSLACSAATGMRDVFEPFPAFLLSKEELRGRSGWFSQPSAGGVSSTTAKKNATHNKQLLLLLNTLQSIPSMKHLKGCSNENSLKRKLAEAAFVAEKKRRQLDQMKMSLKEMRLSYDLTRFILSTNRSSLRVLTGNEKLDLGVPTTFQFVVLHDAPEKEELFEKQRASSGSFFAFHGSERCNWYSILRNGLRAMSNTQYMSNGSALGSGIYLSTDLDVSKQYTKNTSSSASWTNGRVTGEMAVLAICEVVGQSQRASGTILVIPSGREHNVSLRYLLVMDIVMPKTVSIQGSTLRKSLGSRKDQHEFTELRLHYERLRNGEQEERTKMLLDQRMQAFDRAKEDMARDDMARRGTGHGDVAPSTTPAPAAVRERSGSASSEQERTEKAGSRLSTSAGDKTAAARDSLAPRLEENHNPAGATAAATQAITKEFRKIQSGIRKAKAEESSSQGHRAGSFLSDIIVNIPNETDLYTWNVVLHENLFKSNHNLYKDLKALATVEPHRESSVLLEVTFSGMYPFEPPFIRVVRPRFVFHTGHVTIGGSICMELLTLNGWLPTFSFENVLVQIVLAFMEGDGRIDKKMSGREYSRQEAQEAFRRVAGQHQWKVGSQR